MNEKDEKGLQPQGQQLRRNFLKSMALTGGGVAVVATMGQAVAAGDEGELEATPAATTGYHETQHIRDYYAKAKF